MKAAALGALLLLAGPATAAEPPSAHAVAQQGTLKVAAAILLSDRGAELKGVWLDSKLGCRASRPLRVEVLIDLVDAAARTTRVRRSRRGSVANCSEGGPNFGFDLVPRRVGLGCASGRWKPGRYAITTRVTELRSGIVAAASLYREVTRGC